MTNLVRSVGIAASIVASLTLFSGCAINMKVPITDPVPSTGAYRKPSSAPAPVALVFKDERSGADKAKLVTGRIPMSLVSGDKRELLKEGVRDAEQMRRGLITHRDLDEAVRHKTGDEQSPLSRAVLERDGTVSLKLADKRMGG